MFDVLDMGASGLQAQRTRMDTIAGNIVNANTTRNAQGQPIPYRRRFVLFAPGQAGSPDKPGVLEGPCQPVSERRNSQIRATRRAGIKGRGYSCWRQSGSGLLCGYLIGQYAYSWPGSC